MVDLPATAREGLVEAGAQLTRAGVVPGTSGNVSVRVGGLVGISPRGVSLGALRPHVVAVHALDGSVVRAPMAPSSELPLHLAVYAAGKAGAIVHTHSPAAVAVSTLVDELPPIHYYVAALGACVRVAPYAPFGSVELAEGAVHALRDSNVALLAHHGAVAVGADLQAAVENALTLEWLCDVYLRAASAGTPRTLDEHQLARARRDLEIYLTNRQST
ncbi:MAG: class II aldolase/adducin family protein [Sporichthyaceae bacterium]